MKDSPDDHVPLALKFPRLDGKPGEFELRDYRGNDPWVVQDRELALANWKILSGFLQLNQVRLAELGYQDFKAAVERDRALAKRGAGAARYLTQTARNLLMWLRAATTGEYSRKVAAADSKQSSFAGYSKAYELLSYFAEPTWHGWVDGTFTRAPMLLHHQTNMEKLAAILRQWDARSVLEFGCGSGINLALLRKVCELPASVELSGFEYPLNRAFTARATIEALDLDIRELFCADGMNLPCADGSYDVLYSHYVIEQLAGFEQRALSEMLRVARRGVVLFETALYRPTLNQRIYMAHCGYSKN